MSKTKKMIDKELSRRSDISAFISDEDENTPRPYIFDAPLFENEEEYTKKLVNYIELSQIEYKIDNKFYFIHPSDQGYVPIEDLAFVRMEKLSTFAPNSNYPMVDFESNAFKSSIVTVNRIDESGNIIEDSYDVLIYKNGELVEVQEGTVGNTRINDLEGKKLTLLKSLEKDTHNFKEILVEESKDKELSEALETEEKLRKELVKEEPVPAKAEEIILHTRPTEFSITSPTVLVHEARIESSSFPAHSSKTYEDPAETFAVGSKEIEEATKKLSTIAAPPVLSTDLSDHSENTAEISSTFVTSETALFTTSSVSEQHAVTNDKAIQSAAIKPTMKSYLEVAAEGLKAATEKLLDVSASANSKKTQTAKSEIITKTSTTTKNSRSSKICRGSRKFFPEATAHGQTLNSSGTGKPGNVNNIQSPSGLPKTPSPTTQEIS
ncbi:MAG: hypothetical protein ACK4OM_02500 [Alphaproteobacteria bacterium]